MGKWFQDVDKIHKKKQKKHAFKIHFRPFEVILDQLFFPFLGRRVVQDGDKIHKKNKKNMPLKSILDHFKSF